LVRVLVVTAGLSNRQLGQVHNLKREGSSPSPAIMAIDIETQANAPAKVQGDSGSVEQHSLKDQIAADKYLASKSASGSKGLGIKFVKLCPDGAVDGLVVR
jgi:hypothetical protein